MSEPFLGEIRIFAFDFAPKGWATCGGQIISIAQQTALFSILGTTYGGNGQTTFALPDLRSRVPVHMGQGPGLPPYDLGQLAGEENHQLTMSEMPIHTHTFGATAAPGTKKPIAGGIFGDDVDTQAVDYFATPNAPGTSFVTLSPLSMPAAGSSLPHSNMQPYLAVNICMALQGIFPSRN